MTVTEISLRTKFARTIEDNSIGDVLRCFHQALIVMEAYCKQQSALTMADSKKDWEGERQQCAMVYHELCAVRDKVASRQ
jgi:hypothetical protein